MHLSLLFLKAVDTSVGTQMCTWEHLQPWLHIARLHIGLLMFHRTIKNRLWPQGKKTHRAFFQHCFPNTTTLTASGNDCRTLRTRACSQSIGISEKVARYGFFFTVSYRAYLDHVSARLKELLLALNRKLSSCDE